MTKETIVTPDSIKHQPNNSSLLLQDIMEGNVAATPNFEHVTFRKKRNPADQNLWSSVNSSEQNISNINLCSSHTEDLSEQMDPIVENETLRENISRQLLQVRKLKHYEYEKYQDVKDICEQTLLVTNIQDQEREIAPWDKHNTGFATRMMKKMNYGGKGLGKSENGIIEPIMPSVNRGLSKLLLGGYSQSMSNSNLDLNTKEHVQNNYTKPWPKGTTLITGDSILCGIEEKRLKKAKVRVFLGACVEDMYHYLTPLLKKKPTNIILHIGSNDAPYKSSANILMEIMDLKKNILSLLPMVNIHFSLPTLRVDNAKANEVLRELEGKLKSVCKDTISNSNVDRGCLGKKGLHLNPKGSGRLAINFISLMRRL